MPEFMFAAGWVQLSFSCSEQLAVNTLRSGEMPQNTCVYHWFSATIDLMSAKSPNWIFHWGISPAAVR
jgi:hypothetical protein